MTVSDPDVAGRLAWVIGATVAGLIGVFLVMELGSYVSPWVVFGCCVALMVAADAFALVVVARRSTRSAALRCGAVGLAALIVQAGGVYLSALLVLDVLTFPGSGWLFWTLPAVALVSSTVLLGRRSRRSYGWAVLIGSAEGFALLIGFLAAAIDACNCFD